MRGAAFILFFGGSQTSASGGGDEYTPSLDFSDERNSQYIPLFWSWSDTLVQPEDWQPRRGVNFAWQPNQEIAPCG